jgi:hypothetical protein
MTEQESPLESVPDELKYIVRWHFKPKVSESFQFNEHQGQRLDGAMYDDQPTWEMNMQFEAARHDRQTGRTRVLNEMLVDPDGEPRLPGLLNAWWDVAAAIYGVTLVSKMEGRLQQRIMGRAMAEKAQKKPARQSRTQASSSEDEEALLLLGVTPNQPILWSSKYTASGTHIPEPIPQRSLCLFNVIVACEWWPLSQSYQREVMWAFRRMSDFLYDVTDGYMALGHVAIGNSDWMDYADIQILASNRLHPRSWVSGLQIEPKYMPIRVGRGRWNKSVGRTIPWDEPEGYRDLVHEWAHYALGLKDRYLGTRPLYLKEGRLVEAGDGLPAVTLALPSINLPLESVMSSMVGTSELVNNSGVDGKASEWANLQWRFPDLRIPDTFRANMGPGALPLPLPEIQFIELASATPKADPQDEPRFSPPVNEKLPKPGAQTGTYFRLGINHCWVFTVRGTLDKPQNLIAHGTLEDRSITQAFALPGAQEQDIIILIGEGYEVQPTLDGEAPKIGGDTPKPLVLTHTITSLNQETGECKLEGSWDVATPERFPLVDVYPRREPEASKPYHIRAEVDADGWRGWIFPLGSSKLAEQLAWSQNSADQSRSLSGQISTESGSLSSLDGHILMLNDAMQVTVAAYSIGGGPATVSVPFPAPITAGSSEGNAMLFFYDPKASIPRPSNAQPNASDVPTSSTAADPGETAAPKDVSQDDEPILTVTTRNHGISIGGDDYQTCSYTYSLAPNKQLPVGNVATLVLAIDRATPGNDNALEMRRYTGPAENGSWQQKVPALHDPALSIVAAPLYGDTEKRYQPPASGVDPSAPGLFANDIKAERYQLVKSKK